MLLVRREAKQLIKAARSGVDPCTLSIHSVHQRNDPDRLTKFPFHWYWSSDRHFSHEDEWEGGVHPWRSPYPWRSSRKFYDILQELPSSAILSTCRTIAAEGSLMLYQNTIEFDLDPTNPDGSDIKLSTRAICNLSSNIFKYDSSGWSETITPTFCAAIFAAFLNVIGPGNASKLISLSFYASDADRLAHCLPAVTALVADHLPSLRRLGIHVGGRGIRAVDRGSPEDWHPSSNSPFYAFWRNRGFTPLYKELESFLERVSWLREFVYEGQVVFDFSDQNEGGYRKLKALEDVVRSRNEDGVGAARNDIPPVGRV